MDNIDEFILRIIAESGKQDVVKSIVAVEDDHDLVLLSCNFSRKHIVLRENIFLVVRSLCKRI